jgi:hypothetical protein
MRKLNKLERKEQDDHSCHHGRLEVKSLFHVVEQNIFAIGAFPSANLPLEPFRKITWSRQCSALGFCPLCPTERSRA